jgi:large subunit ribosomal protein L3
VNSIIGEKVGMTQIYLANGKAVPVTVVKVGPCEVIQVKSKDKDRYSAVQLGYGMVKPGSLNKPLRGHFQKYAQNSYRTIREVVISDEPPASGTIIGADFFKPGELVSATGMSKGKGFAGVMKRHHFRGGDATHGSMFHREPGSIGSSAYPSRVLKNKKLPGHMGHRKVTIKNLEVVEVKAEANLVLLKGAVPGHPGTILVFKKD